jgi:hypothetical protein
MNFSISRKRTRDEIEDYEHNQLQSLSHLCSWEIAQKEGLYFPTRRVRTNSPSKLDILKRIEKQDFTDMDDTHLDDCWQEMARQIKSFKRKLRKVSDLYSQKESIQSQNIKSSFEYTHQIISNPGSDVPSDHKDLLKNLVKVIDDGRMSPGSLAFDRISTLVRSSMGKKQIDSIESTQSIELKLKLQDKTIPITSQEYDQYRNFKNDIHLLSIITGTLYLRLNLSFRDIPA